MNEIMKDLYSPLILSLVVAAVLITWAMVRSYRKEKVVADYYEAAFKAALAEPKQVIEFTLVPELGGEVKRTEEFSARRSCFSIETAMEGAEDTLTQSFEQGFFTCSNKTHYPTCQIASAKIKEV